MDTSPPLSDPPVHPSNVNMELHHALSLQLTWKCNARCRFCGLDCSPDTKVTMPYELVEKISAEAKAAYPRMWHTEITGGEVFTEFDLLQRVANRFTNLDFKWAAVTNGFWATSAEKTKDMLSRLPGLWILCLSVDSHHREFVPQENLVRIVKAAHELNIDTFVTIGYFAGEKPTLDLMIPELRELLQAEVAHYHYYPALDLGRARDCLDEIPQSSVEGPCYLLCRLEVTPHGEYGACCVTSRAVPGGLEPLKMGSAWEYTEAEMHEKFLQTPLLLALATLGPLEVLRRIEPEMTKRIESRFKSICSPCMTLCKLPNVAQRVENMLERDNLWPTVHERMMKFYKIDRSRLPMCGEVR